MAYTRSVSQLKSFSRCGEQFRIERLNRKKIPETPAAWTALGVGLHEAFCDWERSDRTIDVTDAFVAYYDNYIAEALERQPDFDYWQVPPGTKSVKNSIDNYRKRALERDVPEYEQRCLEAEWEIYRFEDGSKALELEFELEFEGVVVRGALDRVQWWPSSGTATIEDLKSGNLEPYDFRQLGTYAYAARTIFGIPVTHGRYWHTKYDKGGEWTDLTRYTKDYLGLTYKKLDEAILNNIFLPNPGKICDLCSVKTWCRELGTETI